MAAVLTDELTRVSVASIEKWDEGPDGTVYVYGRCTTPEVDTDEQVVDSGWSGPALKEYLATAPTVRVQHNPQRDPAGSAVRVDVNRDGDGAHWLKAAVDEPAAQRLVKKGHLRAFSMGIARPVIERDLTGKARGGIIKGGKIVEVSLVDSPANRSCFLEIAKSAADGTCEFTGKVGGSEDVLAKALGGDLLTKAVAGDLVNVDLPPGASISISPADFARLHTFKQQLVTKTAGATIEADAEKRDIGTAERERIASEGNAVRNDDGHVSYPIENAGDLQNAAVLARSGHGDVAAARRLIARRAEELGVANPLNEGTEANKSSNEAEAALLTASLQTVMLAEDALKEAEPEVTKDPQPEGEPKPAKKAKKKKMPPWLNKPKDDDDGDAKSGSDGSDDSASKVCKSFLDHTWIGTDAAGSTDVQCSKCHTTPAAAAGVTASPMQAAPVKELQESDGPASTKGATPASASGAVAEAMKPVPAHREPDGAAAESFEADAGMSDGDKAVKYATDLAPDPEVAALLRFKATGTDEDLGRLHDLTCPAYSPEMAAKYHPYADMGALIDSGAWQRKTLAAAAGPLEGALKMQEMWQAALLLKTAEPGDLNDWRLELHKAFRDANPGPGSYPTPGCVSPQRYNRPVLGDGRAANSVDYGAPNSSPQVATGAPDAHSFARPPLSGAHQSPSPSHMKGDGQYPGEQGVPTQLTYAQMQREGARQALTRMHEHLSRQFPEACPMSLDGPQQPERKPVPVPAGIGKSDEAPVLAKDLAEGVHNGDISIDDARKALGLEPFGLPETSVPVAAFKAPVAEVAEWASDEIYKGFKKMRKKLGKKVLSGKMTVDEARARMGRQFAQKTAELSPQEIAEGIQKGTMAVDPGLIPAPAAALTPDLIKAAVREALHVETVPLEAAQIGSFDPSPAIEAAVTKALTPFAEQFTTKLAEQQKVIDAIADQPDPSTAAFSGLAFQPQVTKSRRPAAVPDQAEYAARAQQMIRRNLQNTYQTHSDPHVREAAGSALANLGVGTEAPPMT